MRGEQYLTRSWQYSLVYRTGKSRANRYLVMRFAPSGLTLSRYGISVSRRVGIAVVRNRVKRLFREILRRVALKPGWDIVIIARQPAAGASYDTLKMAACQLLADGQLLQRENEAACLTAD